jgi:hypothetical protein
MTKIAHAAIKKDGIVYVGKRHHNCIRTMADCGLSLPVTKGAIQGFVTDEGAFVDRKEAFVIASNANQIIEKHGGKDELYSEDIY